MADNHLDGVFFQRFLSDLSGSVLGLRNQVAMNVRTGAETYHRVFAIMYDISGYSTNSLISALTNDWAYLVNTQHVTAVPLIFIRKASQSLPSGVLDSPADRTRRPRRNKRFPGSSPRDAR